MSSPFSRSERRSAPGRIRTCDPRIRSRAAVRAQRCMVPWLSTPVRIPRDSPCDSRLDDVRGGQNRDARHKKALRDSSACASSLGTAIAAPFTFGRANAARARSCSRFTTSTAVGTSFWFLTKSSAPFAASTTRAVARVKGSKMDQRESRPGKGGFLKNGTRRRVNARTQHLQGQASRDADRVRLVATREPPAAWFTWKRAFGGT